MQLWPAAREESWGKKASPAPTAATTSQTSHRRGGGASSMGRRAIGAGRPAPRSMTSISIDATPGASFGLTVPAPGSISVLGEFLGMADDAFRVRINHFFELGGERKGGNVGGGIPANGGIEPFEGLVRHLRRQLGAITDELVVLMNDENPARLLHRGLDGRPIERLQTAKVNDLDRDTEVGERSDGFQAEVGHGPIAKDGDVGAGVTDRGLPERNSPFPFGIRALAKPVELLGFEEYHRIRVLHGRHQQALDVGRGRRNHDFEAGNVGIEGFDRLRVVKRPVDAASERHPYDNRAGPAPVASIMDPGGLRHDLVESGVDVIGKLDLGDRAFAGCGHPDGRAGDE